MLPSGGKITKDLLDVCQSCVYGKQHRLHRTSSLSHIPMPCAQERLELTHSDVEEVSPISHGGYRYFILFIDDFSQMTFGFLMKNKNEVLVKFREFRCTVEKATV